MKDQKRIENSLGKGTSRSTKLNYKPFSKIIKNDSLPKKGNTFQLEGNELEQLIDTDSKD